MLSSPTTTTTSLGRAGRLAALGAASTLLLAGLAACGSSSGTSDAAGTDGARGSGSGAAQVAVTMTSDGGGDVCHVDRTSVAAGPVTFTVKNESATGITEFELLSDQRIVAEKESLAPGLDAATLTVTLDGGTYQVYCPGAAQENTDLTVTGTAPSSSASAGTTQQALQQGAHDYASYVDTQVAAMVKGAGALRRAVDSGDLAAAQAAYADARIFYERIESDVEGFVLPGFAATDNHGNLDYLIDMRASNLDPAVGWHGFHAVERDLFERKAITPGTKAMARQLDTNVVKLSGLVKGLSYKPEDLANGAAGLLEEVQANKISGEEEAYSHIDLVDFAGNLEGAQQSFAYLKPGLERIDATLTDTIAQRFEAVSTMLDTYRDKSGLGGYVAYTPQLRKSDANKLSQTVQGLQDSLSRLAEKVATA